MAFPTAVNNQITDAVSEQTDNTTANSSSATADAEEMKDPKEQTKKEKAPGQHD